MKTALITGATRGIGRAILEKYLNEGITVIGTYNASDKIARELIEKYGQDKLSFFQFNQGEPESHKALLESLPERIDILVNNAGLGSKTVEKVSSNKFEQDLALLKVNSLGPLWLCEEIIPRMTQGGKVINISSVGGGIFHFPGFRLADGMSKAAVTFLTKQMAAENVYTNIDIFAICPGATETDMFNASTLQHLSENERKSLVENLPKKSLINPKEIAELSYFLTKAESKILHGAILDSSQGLGVNPGVLQK